MDVFRQLGDAVGDLYSTNYTNDHALNSPDLSVYAMSPTSIFMYEHDNEPIPLTKSSTDNMRGDSSNPLFDAPWSEEMTDLGCSIGDSFLSESSFCGSSLNDSDVKEAVWDFLGYDDVSSPLQHPDDDFLHSPTLAELNMEDTGTQNFDVYSGGAGQPPSAFSQQPVQAKTKPVLIKQNSQRHRQQDFTKKVHAGGLSHDKYSSLFTLSKSHPIQSNQHKTTPMVPQSQSLHNQVKTEPLKFPASNQSGDTITPSKNCLSFSNLFGQRTRTFASNQLHQAKDQSKVVVKTEAVAHDTHDDSSMDRKWEEIKNFIHQDTVRKMKQEEYDDFEDEAVSSPTKLTFKKHAHGYSVKSEKTEFQSSRKRTESASSGFESHDEGLGSEHEIEDCSDDDGILGQEEDVSDMSDVEDDAGLAASSSTGKYSRVKSRRSEYDDMTPNPRKLLHIGNELRKLNKIISDMAPVSELSGSARNRCRKEKNKLASRACRLKKKAQHEANKIKLSGLDNEHTRLLLVLTSIKKDMVKRVQNREGKHNASLNHRLDNLIKSNLGQMVAGHTNEYVNMVMERTAREKSNATKEK